MLRILHAADLHLDSPFSGLTPELAAQRRKQQRRLPAEIVRLCNDHGCDLLLLAGDVFDGARVCPETLDALQRALAECRARVFIAPGNHDPYTDRSPWQLLDWPDHVHVFTGPWEAVELPELGCRVWGSAFTGGECHDGLPAATAGSGLEIAVCHGDPETAGPYRPLFTGDIRDSGLDYLALGHIHKTALPRQLGRTWYGWPGVAMGRGFDECGEHGVFLVQLERNRCETQLLPLPGPRYESITVPAGQTPQLPKDGSQVICRLTFTGEADNPDLDWLREQLAPRFLSLELRDHTEPPRELWAACGDGTLRGTALEILRTRHTDGDQGEAALAARYVLAALEGREAP